MGKISTIRLALSNLPFYYMSLLLMRTGMRKRLDRVRRDFLWKGHSDKRKVHLLANWFWRFGEENEVLWRKVIASQYGAEDSGWVLGRVPRYLMSGVWGNILKFGDASFMGGECL